MKKYILFTLTSLVPPFYENSMLSQENTRVCLSPLPYTAVIKSWIPLTYDQANFYPPDRMLETPTQ